MIRTQTILKTIAVLFFIQVIIVGCGDNSTTTPELPDQRLPTIIEKTTIIVDLTNTPIVNIPSTPTTKPKATDTPRPSNTPRPTKPAKSIEYQWEIQTGDLQYFGVGTDGTIYGVGENLYAVISKDGKVSSTSSLDLKGCLRSNFEGGAGSYGISDWFVISHDGTIQSFAFNPQYGPCAIYPGDPPVLERFEHGIWFFPYADDYQPHDLPSIPDGYKRSNYGISFKWGREGGYFWLDDRRDGFQFYINEDKTTAGFVNHNAEFKTIDLPDSLDNLIKGKIILLITPWDDVYMVYQELDELGNNIGENVIVVKSDGSTESINELPIQLRRKPITYLPERSEIYYIEEDQLVSYDLDFHKTASFSLPADFEEVNYLNLSVGHDLGFYVFDDHWKTLRKYQIMGVE